MSLYGKQCLWQISLSWRVNRNLVILIKWLYMFQISKESSKKIQSTCKCSIWTVWPPESPLVPLAPWLKMSLCSSSHLSSSQVHVHVRTPCHTRASRTHTVFLWTDTNLSNNEILYYVLPGPAIVLLHGTDKVFSHAGRQFFSLPSIKLGNEVSPTHFSHPLPLPLSKFI